MKASEWIDRIKAAAGWDSDYRVSKELQLSRQAVSDYRGKTVSMDEETAIKVARVLSIDPALVLADQAMERAKNEEARNAWAAVLEYLLRNENPPELESAGGDFAVWRRRRDSNPR
jgi:ABC-type lipoprotein export system ATPase subunit